MPVRRLAFPFGAALSEGPSDGKAIARRPGYKTEDHAGEQAHRHSTLTPRQRAKARRALRCYSDLSTSRIDSPSTRTAKSACSSSMTNGGQSRIVFSPAPSTSKPSCKRAVDDAVAQIRGALLGLLVPDDFDADHEAFAANVAHDAELAGPATQASQQIIAHAPGVFHVFVLDQSQGRERRGNADGISAEGRGMGARGPIHDAGGRNGRGKRQAGSDALGNTNDVGLNPGVIAGPPLAGAAHAALNLVGDQQDAVLAADVLQLDQKFARRRDVAAFALNRLDDNGRDFFRVDNLAEELVLDETRHIRRSTSQAIARTGSDKDSDTATWKTPDSSAPKPLRCTGLRCRERERAHGATVEGAVEGDDLGRGACDNAPA